MAKIKPRKEVEEVLAQATGGEVKPYKHVAISSCEPNPWNPNKMPPAVREKLVAGIKMLLKSNGHIPPIIVRPHPNPEDGIRWQIIDGFHRWDVLRSEGAKRIDAYILDVDTKTAMILTDTLNYLRGAPDADLQGEYYRRLLNEEHVPLPELASYVSDSEEEIRAIMEANDIQIEKIEIPSTKDVDQKAAEDAELFLDVKFFISRAQAEVVERELARISAGLEGKNIRGRALEFMAVNSSQTPLESMDMDPLLVVKKKKSSKKKKLRDRLRQGSDG